MISIGCGAFVAMAQPEYRIWHGTCLTRVCQATDSPFQAEVADERDIHVSEWPSEKRRRRVRDPTGPRSRAASHPNVPPQFPTRKAGRNPASFRPCPFFGE